MQWVGSCDDGLLAGWDPEEGVLGREGGYWVAGVLGTELCDTVSEEWGGVGGVLWTGGWGVEWGVRRGWG